jgi:predicted CDP-diglyceride synthetase/phosphatidate cytidylyltransferase
LGVRIPQDRHEKAAVCWTAVLFCLSIVQTPWTVTVKFLFTSYAALQAFEEVIETGWKEFHKLKFLFRSVDFAVFLVNPGLMLSESFQFKPIFCSHMFLQQ